MKDDKRQVIQQSNFSQIIKNVFYKVYGEPISVRFLRMSWISRLYKSNPTVKEMKDLAHYMANSVDEQRKYNKVFKNKK